MKQYFTTVGAAMLLTLCGLFLIPMIFLIIQHMDGSYDSWLQKILDNIK